MKILKFREDISYKFNSDMSCEVYGFKNFKMIELSVYQRALIEKLWSHGLLEDEVLSLEKELSILIKFLNKKSILRFHEEDFTRNELWISHFFQDPKKVLEILGKKHVVILGCGGTGSIIADHLARAGVKKFTVIDGAEVDAPDLNRQFIFRKNNINHSKSIVIENYLKEEFDVSVSSHHKSVYHVDDLIDLGIKDADLFINCADQPQFSIEKIVLEFCIKKNIPVLMGAVGISDGHISSIMITEESKKTHLKEIIDLEKLNISSKIMKGSICFLNTLISVQIALRAFEFLTQQKMAIKFSKR